MKPAEPRSTWHPKKAYRAANRAGTAVVLTDGQFRGSRGDSRDPAARADGAVQTVRQHVHVYCTQGRVHDMPVADLKN